MIKPITDLTPQQQDHIRKTLKEYYVNVDPLSQKRYIRVFGEDVDVASIVGTGLLFS